MLKIGMFTYSDPDINPQFVHPARVLARAGYCIDFVSYYRCGNSGEPEDETGLRFLRLNRAGEDFPHSTGGRIKGVFDFVRESIRIAKRERYDIVYGHDMHGFLAAHQVGRLLRVPVIYHCHDLVEWNSAGGLDRWVKCYEIRYSKEALAVILPESRRARVLRKQNSLIREPFIVWNCPLKGPRTRAPRLDRLLHREGRDGHTYVIRHGALWTGGNGHCIEETVSSMVYWPEEVDFVLLGTIASDYAERLKDLVSRHGVHRRLYFLHPVRYGDVFDIIGGARLGLALYEPVDINKRYQSTASLKFFEYMRAGLPVLVSDERGFKRLIDEFECGTSVSPEDPVAIGKAVKDLLTNEPLRARLGENAYRAHLEECNYETQYQPVLEFLKTIC